MPSGVKRRRYDASRRREAAAARRQRVLDVASALFAQQGYAATTMSEIASRAGVALDTIYATIGTKPNLFRLLLETAISGTDQPVPVLERNYVTEIRLEDDPHRKLAIYAAALTRIQARIAPLYLALQAAAPYTPELAAIWQELLARRARNMPLLIAELQRTGAMRRELTVGQAVDTVWAINSTEVYVLLRDERQWTEQRYEHWLSTTLARLLLDEAA